MTIIAQIKDAVFPSKESGYRSKLLQSKVLLYFVVALLVLKIATVLIPINFPYNIFFADITKSSLENFVNQTRQSIGLKPLSENEKLNQAAQMKAQNMVQEQYFNHTSPSGVTPWFWFKQAGYSYKFAGENLAVGFYESEEVYNAWLNSASHKANIVNPNYTEIGTAVLKGFGSNSAIIVVQEFGSRAVAKKTPVNNNSKLTETKPPETITGQENSDLGVNEQVLSQTTESQGMLGSPSGNANDSLISKSLNFAIYNYEDLLQNVIYGVSLIVIGILLALIFFSFNLKFKRQLVFRTVLVVIILSAAMLLNKEIIISLIPHQVII